MKRLLKIGLTLGIVISCVLSSIGVSAYAVQKSVVQQPSHYVPKVDSQGNFYVPQTIATGNPTISSGGWTNPTNAYTSGSGYADITSGSPSASETYNGFGFAYYGSVINQVRVRTDAWCVGIVQSKIVYPTSDYTTATGTWSVFPASPTTKWDKVDEAVSDGDSTYLLEGTTAGYAMFGFASPGLLPNVTIQNVTVTITARDNTSGTNKIQPALRVGGTNYLTTSTSTEVPVSYGTISYSYTTNPKTGVAWTVADVNGTGTNPLQYFGTNSADANPQIRITQVNMTVNYTTGTDETLNVYDSWDGGTTWSSAHNIQLTGTQLTYWTDVTADTAWTYSKLLDTNFRAKVEAVTVGDVSDIRLDYLTTEVTYGTGNYQDKWLGSYETLIFVGASVMGDLKIGQYALDGNGTGYYVRLKDANQWQFDHVDLTYDITGLAQVQIAPNNHAYYDEFLTAQGAVDLWTPTSQYYMVDPSLLPTGDVVRILSTSDRYKSLGTVSNYPQPIRTENTSLTPPPEPSVASIAEHHSIGYDNATSSGYKLSVSSYTFSHTCGATANLLVFGGGDYNNSPYTTVTGVTYNSISMTFIRQDAYPTVYYSSIWFMYSPGTGSAYTVAVTLSATSDAAGGGCVSYSGAAQSGQPEANNGADNSTGVPTVNVDTTGTDNCWVVASLTSDRDHATAQTQRWASNSDFRFYGSDTNAPVHPAGVKTMNWSNSLLSWCVSAASFAPAPSITNSPSSISFGTVMPGTTYYAKGTAPANPVIAGNCSFTITNTATSSVNIALSCTNATGGTTWTLVSGTPAGNQFKVTCYAVGDNPASGLVLTASNQAWKTIAGGETLSWDFQELLGGTGTGKSGTFSDSTQKTYTITLTGS
jgi:hypothetical protein